MRRLDPSEHALLRTLRLRALADTPSAFGSTYERELAFTDDEWRRRLHPDANPHFVCGDLDAEPVGIVAVGIDRTEVDGPVAHVWGMWVDPAAREHRRGRRAHRDRDGVGDDQRLRRSPGCR